MPKFHRKKLDNLVALLALAQPGRGTMSIKDIQSVLAPSWSDPTNPARNAVQDLLKQGLITEVSSSTYQITERGRIEADKRQMRPGEYDDYLAVTNKAGAEKKRRAEELALCKKAKLSDILPPGRRGRKPRQSAAITPPLPVPSMPPETLTPVNSPPTSGSLQAAFTEWFRGEGLSMIASELAKLQPIVATTPGVPQNDKTEMQESEQRQSPQSGRKRYSLTEMQQGGMTEQLSTYEKACLLVDKGVGARDKSAYARVKELRDGGRQTAAQIDKILGSFVRDYQMHL